MIRKVHERIQGVSSTKQVVRRKGEKDIPNPSQPIKSRYAEFLPKCFSYSSTDHNGRLKDQIEIEKRGEQAVQYVSCLSRGPFRTMQSGS